MAVMIWDAVSRMRLKCARMVSALRGMPVSTSVVADDAASIKQKLVEAVANHDALITSGGAWKGERDLVVRLLDELGWTKHFHRIRRKEDS